jgi:aspartokinase-like uncharacterized kinase
VWIIKIGGSLQDSVHLQPWLDCILAHGGGRAVLVPGGGRFADAIRLAQRRFGFDDTEAHRRAIRAMEEFATYLCARAPQLVPARDKPALLRSLAENKVPVWLPSAMALDQPDLPATWDVTSDSLALWLAHELGAEGLVLVKSVAVDELMTLDELADNGVIDACFPDLFQRSPVNLAWYTAGGHEKLAELLDYGVLRVMVSEP